MTAMNTTTPELAAILESPSDVIQIAVDEIKLPLPVTSHTLQRS